MIEVIGKDLIDIIKINKTEADQIEFCINLELEGLTPIISEIKQLSKIDNSKKIRIMLRNHHDNFFINENQLEELIDVINQTKHISNIDGYVFGAITKENKIDFSALKKILNSIGKKTLTFHKAFDLITDKIKELNELMKYKKVKYVLTSGGIGNPLENLDFFKSVPKNFKDRILVGGGVNDKVIKKLSKLGFKNFHTGTFVRKRLNYDSSVSNQKIKYLKTAITVGEKDKYE